jgi:hypothetical protein
MKGCFLMIVLQQRCWIVPINNAEWLNLPHCGSVGILLLNVNRQTVPLAAFKKATGKSQQAKKDNFSHVTNGKNNRNS